MARKWTKASAEQYVKTAEKKKERGLTYWSAKDFLRHHKTMSSIL